MAARIGTAIVALPALGALVWVGGPSFAALVTVAALVAASEAGNLVRSHTGANVAIPATALAITFPVSVYLAANGVVSYSVVALAPVGLGGLALAALWAVHRSLASAMRATALALLAALYTGGLLSYAILLRDADQGRSWIFLALGVIFASDTCALFLGRYAGRLKMAPAVSPGKTWEGAAGGLVAGIGAGIALKYLLDLDGAAWQIALVSAAAGVAGQVGDLAESKLKRLAGVKDSGHLLPGHGGLLDRIDSIVAALPLMYYFLIWWIQ